MRRYTSSRPDTWSLPRQPRWQGCGGHGRIEPMASDRHPAYAMSIACVVLAVVILLSLLLGA